MFGCDLRKTFALLLTAAFLLSLLSSCAIPMKKEESEAESLLGNGYYAVYDEDDDLVEYWKVNEGKLLLIDIRGAEEGEYRLRYDEEEDRYSVRELHMVFSLSERDGGLRLKTDDGLKYFLKKVSKSVLPTAEAVAAETEVKTEALSSAETQEETAEVPISTETRISEVPTAETAGPPEKQGTIRVWVEEDAAWFYQNVCWQYTASHPEFSWEIEVNGMDIGSVTVTITQDPQAAADIYTVAHDNIGKLADRQCAKPITDQALIDQVLADNPAPFQNVIYSSLNGMQNVYGIPYNSQALLLYYNKALVTEKQARSFEGLREAARAAGSKAITVTGDDGYNMSFALLATRLRDHYTSVKLYEGAESVQGGSKGRCYCQGDDTVAIFRWLQAYAADPNGFAWPSFDGWDADLDRGSVLAVIAGPWYYDTVKDIVGSENLGIAMIPTFTLTSEATEGLWGVAAGDVYRGGTFSDCRCFMINAFSDPAKYEAEQELLRYLTSKEVQNKAYLETLTVPAYAGAAAFIEDCYHEGKVSEHQYKLAAVQTAMSEWGIPQPFVTGTLNVYYYSKNAPAIFRAIIDRTAYPLTGDRIISETVSLTGIRKALYVIEYVWMHGVLPRSIPDSLPAGT